MTHTITIKTAPKFAPMRVIYHVLAQLLVIGVGVMTGSAAMQWFGFLALTLIVVALSHSASKRDEAMTISQARDYINKIEQNEVKQ